MPNSAGHVKFVMPPIGSIGSGLASYRDLTRTLTDEKGTLYSALSAIVYMVTAVTRKNFDKIGRARSFLRQRNSSWGQLRQEDEGF
ncbi:hypothetical protein DAPPUDRAFT_335370 [Daphnia pulex]|uniref:Uncharacterized protein n=1 Tax=Daphnia pulex TaxID=6669 RepID=E9HXL7_DAPPU|nr:hypothetical protein DAPPUDRAFT_335370 [Daphnia pulex]|eukprot:EFX63513.1 hypothetical protein DAPPUDRAFT_335370 [Daphnia pulex]